MAAPTAATQPGPEWDRLAARSRSTLVRQERLALSSLRTAVKAATGPALLALSRLPTAEPRATADAGIALLRAAAPRLVKGFAAALLARRLDTKRAAVGRVSDEWRAVRAAVRARGYADPGALGEAGTKATHTDHAAVESTSGSYAAAWQSATADALWTWAAAPGDGQGPADAAAAAEEAQDYRVRRIATTDTAQAYADARDEATDAAARRHPDATWIPAVLKRWDATLDRRVCARCRALDGVLRPLGVDFPGGRDPGHVHPGCRCDSHLVFIPLRIPHDSDNTEAA